MKGIILVGLLFFTISLCYSELFVTTDDYVFSNGEDKIINVSIRNSDNSPIDIAQIVPLGVSIDSWKIDGAKSASFEKQEIIFMGKHQQFLHWKINQPVGKISIVFELSDIPYGENSLDIIAINPFGLAKETYSLYIY